MVAPPTACPDCGWVMNGNCLPKHRRARHGQRGEGLLPTREEQELIIKRYRQGRTQAAIAAEVMWSSTTVSRVLREWGERRPERRRIGGPPKLTTDQILEACQLYAAGHSMRAVADILGISSTAVQRRVARGGAETRNAGHATNATLRARAEQQEAA